MQDYRCPPSSFATHIHHLPYPSTVRAITAASTILADPVTSASSLYRPPTGGVWVRGAGWYQRRLRYDTGQWRTCHTLVRCPVQGRCRSHCDKANGENAARSPGAPLKNGADCAETRPMEKMPHAQPVARSRMAQHSVVSG